MFSLHASTNAHCCNFFLKTLSSLVLQLPFTDWFGSGRKVREVTLASKSLNGLLCARSGYYNVQVLKSAISR